MKKSSAASRRVLVVDDDDDMREVVSQTLSQEGYGVQDFGDGATAIETAHRQSFDIAVVNLKMPGISGATVIKQIKQRQPELPVVIITGSPAPEQEELAGMFSRILYKPFRIEELRETVEEILSR